MGRSGSTFESHAQVAGGYPHLEIFLILAKEKPSGILIPVLLLKKSAFQFLKIFFKNIVDFASLVAHWQRI